MEKNVLWWNGPDFIRHLVQYVTDEEPIKILPEEKATVMLAVNQTPKVNLNNIMSIEIFSSYSRLLQVTSWIQRFINNIKSRDKKLTNLSPILQLEELIISERNWTLTNQRELNNTSNEKRLNELNAKTDDHGIIRLIGRLSEARIPYEARVSVLLSNRSQL